MASVRKKTTSPYWFACINLPDGTRQQFSTKLTDKNEALAAAVDAERSFRKYHEQPHQLRAALERIAENYIPAADADPGPWLVTWADSRASECEPATLAAYRTMARDASLWLQERRITSFVALTESIITELRDHWSAKHSGITANSKLKILRVALKVAVGRKLLAENPAAGVQNVKEKKTARREFRPAELQVLIAALTGEWKAIFYLGLNTGQRLNDLAELKWNQLDLAAETVTFHARKTGHLVALPLLPVAVLALTDLASSDDPEAFVFPGIAGYSRPHRSNQFRKILAGAGLAKPVRHKGEKAKGKREMSTLSFHSLRHTATTLLKSAGVSDSVARAIVGHESAAVSRAYTHLDMATMKDALKKMKIE